MQDVESKVRTANLARGGAAWGSRSKLEIATGTSIDVATAVWCRIVKPQSELIAMAPCSTNRCGLQHRRFPTLDRPARTFPTTLLAPFPKRSDNLPTQGLRSSQSPQVPRNDGPMPKVRIQGNGVIAMPLKRCLHDVLIWCG